MIKAVVTNEIRVVRHGESENNVLDIECADISNKALYGLTAVGRRQVADAARQHADVDVILSSPLRRATESATLFAEVCGVEPVVENLLIEQSMGVFEKRPNSEMRAWQEESGHASTKPPGGESHEQVQGRARRLLDSISERYSERKILLVTHGVFIHCLFRVVFDDFGMEEWQDYLEHFANGRRVLRIVDSTYDWQRCS